MRRRHVRLGLLHAILFLSKIAETREQRQRRRWTSWWTVGGQRLWRMHDNGTLVLPPSVRKVFIDVGTHWESQFLRHARASHDIFVLGFEALPQIAEEHSAHPRLLIVPAVVAKPDGQLVSGKRTLFAYDGHLSSFSSLLPLSKAVRESADFASLSREVVVEALTLAEAILRIPTHINISLVKIDAQGYDLEVALSAGAQLHRIDRVELECQDLPEGHVDLLYSGQPTKTRIQTVLREAGFFLERCWDNNPFIREENCIFARGDLLQKTDEHCFEPLLATSQGRRAVSNIGPQIVPDLGLTFQQLTTRAVAHLLEFWCCHTHGDAPEVAGCFSPERNYEMCCLSAYFEGVPRALALGLEVVGRPNASMVHLIWKVLT